MKKKLRTLLIWVLLLGLFLYAFSALRDDKPARFLAFATFLSDAEEGRVAIVEVAADGHLDVHLRDGQRYMTFGELDEPLLEALERSRSPVVPRTGGTSGWWLLAVVLVIFVAVFFFLRKAGGGQFLSMTSFLKSRARVLPEKSTCTFADVGGCSEAKEALRDLVDFLQNPKTWQMAGARVPRGVLLEGPPGCGKTLLARAVAGEAKSKLFFVSASEFVEMFVGVGAARVRDTFETAAKEAPAVIFIDELDAVGRHRGSGVGGSHDEREQTLNQLLVSLDGLQRYERVVVVAASNRSDILDAALLRPGRFDRRIHIARPTQAERLEILGIHTRNKPLAPDVSLEGLAQRMEGLNGAEIEGVTNEAAILAVRRARVQGTAGPRVELLDFERAMELQKKRGGSFDTVDALLIGSSSQVSQPPGRAMARLVLLDGSQLQGELLWANAELIKVRRDGNGSELLVPKSQVRSLEAVDGTTTVGPGEVQEDEWSKRQPGAA